MSKHPELEPRFSQPDLYKPATRWAYWWAAILIISILSLLYARSGSTNSAAARDAARAAQLVSDNKKILDQLKIDREINDQVAKQDRDRIERSLACLFKLHKLGKYVKIDGDPCAGLVLGLEAPVPTTIITPVRPTVRHSNPSTSTSQRSNTTNTTEQRPTTTNSTTTTSTICTVPNPQEGCLH